MDTSAHSVSILKAGFIHSLGEYVILIGGALPKKLSPIEQGVHQYNLPVVSAVSFHSKME